jgi:hypothetical protein
VKEVSARSRILATIAGAASVGAAAAALASASKPDAVRAPGTIGLAITSWDNALVETPDASECSLGLQQGTIEQFKATPGAIALVDEYGGSYETRGPNGETGGMSPMAVEDPLPFSELTTKTGYGLNLDGTSDGHATARTCRHEKFTAPDGTKVDNQMARVIGCTLGYRKGGAVSQYYSEEVATNVVNRHLIEVTGVDDEANDPRVVITIYKGMDRLVRTGENRFVPFLSQRIDPRFPQYTFTTRGRIVDGVLITDPIPTIVMPRSNIRHFNDRVMRNVVLRLKLTPDGADGVMAGYEQADLWYNTQGKMLLAGPGRYSMPSIYRALQRYADGFPDPKTGQCTHISTTYNLTTVRAMIIHPSRPLQ